MSRILLCEFRCIYNSEHDWRGNRCWKCGAKRPEEAPREP